MRGKLTSWLLLFVAFLCGVYALMWFSDDRTWGQIYMIAAIIGGVAATVLTTYLSPRTPLYDVVRYVLMAVLAWIAYYISLWVLVGIAIAAVLLFPSVLSDFRGEREAQSDKRMLFFGKAVVESMKKSNRRLDAMNRALDRHERKQAAKRAAKEAQRKAANRAFEWTAGWYWK